MASFFFVEAILEPRILYLSSTSMARTHHATGPISFFAWSKGFSDCLPPPTRSPCFVNSTLSHCLSVKKQLRQPSGPAKHWPSVETAAPWNNNYPLRFHLRVTLEVATKIVYAAANRTVRGNSSGQNAAATFSAKYVRQNQINVALLSPAASRTSRLHGSRAANLASADY